MTGGKAFYNPDPNAPMGRIPMDRIIQKIDALYDKNEYEEAGRVLAYWKNEAVALRDTHGELAVESELVGYHRKQGNREAGLASIARALTLIRELHQEELVSGATIYVNCATAYHAFEQIEESLPLFQKAEAVYLRELKANDPRLGGLYNNMGMTYMALGQLAEAEEAYHKALGVMEKAFSGEAESAITYINMAHMYEAMGNKEQIIHCLQEAKALLQSERLIHNGYYAFVLEKCAPAYAYFGDMATYEKMMREVERIYAGA